MNSIKEKEVVSNLVSLGPADLDHSRRTRQMLLSCLTRGEDVVVDLSSINYIDSASVASLVEAHAAARKSGKDFSLLHVSAPVMRILRLARLERVFTIIDGTPEARVN